MPLFWLFFLQISNPSASDAFSRHQVALSKSFSPSNVDKAVAFSLLSSAHAQEDEESTGSLTSCLEALLESDSEESFGDGEEGGLTLNEDNVRCLLDVLEQPKESQMDENFSFLPEVTTSDCISSANAEFNFDFTSWAPTGAGKEDEGMKHNDSSSRSAGLSFYSWCLISPTPPRRNTSSRTMHKTSCWKKGRQKFHIFQVVLNVIMIQRAIVLFNLSILYRKMVFLFSFSGL